MNFDNKIILITGAGSGIGQAAALAFAKAGGTLVVSDINEKGGEQTVQHIESAGGKANFIKADVSKYEEVEQLIQSTVKEHGRLDIAINNAGIGGTMAKTHDMPLADWDKVMAVNASGVFYGMKLQIQQMLKQEGGVILNTASVAGLKGLPNSVAYTASKHAVVGMTKSAALEYAKKNIRINAICPVFTITSLFDPNLIDAFSAGMSDKLKSKIPMKRFSTTEEVAKTMLFLCSDSASFITGQAMPLDGGLIA